jgi:hypothetical protein
MIAGDAHTNVDRVTPTYSTTKRSMYIRILRAIDLGERTHILDQIDALVELAFWIIFGDLSTPKSGSIRVLSAMLLPVAKESLQVTMHIIFSSFHSSIGRV